MNRLNSITDCVLAFAMTLLVLNIDIPEERDFSERGLLDFFLSLEHDVVIYAASFFLIARYWVEHHLIFHCIRFVSRMLVWLNFLFLFWVTMLPFATRLKGFYERDAIVSAIFGAVHVACWLSLIGTWRYAAARPDLLQPAVDPSLIRRVTLRLAVGPLTILVAIGLSFFNVRLGNLAFLLVPVVFLLQPAIDPPLIDGVD